MTLAAALALLEIAPDTTEALAQKNYRELLRVWHPDQFLGRPDLLERAETKTRQLNDAWELYNRYLQAGGARLSPTQRRRLFPSGSVSRWDEQWGSRIAFVALGLLAALGFFGYLVASDAFNPELQLAKELARRAYATNLDLPVAVDAETQFVATFSGPGRRFTSIYSIVNYTKDQIGASYFDQLKEGLIRQLRARLADDAELRFFVAQKVILAYSFKDKTGADIVTFEVNPDQW